METLTEYRLSPEVRFTGAQLENLRAYVTDRREVPETVAELEAHADNDDGITQAHLDQFREDLHYGVRCDRCGDIKNQWDDCWMDDET